MCNLVLTVEDVKSAMQEMIFLLLKNMTDIHIYGRTYFYYYYICDICALKIILLCNLVLTV